MVNEVNIRSMSDDMRLYSITYLSKFVIEDVEVGERAISSIVESARANNRKLNVTGALILSGNYFGQIIEGDKDVLETLYQKIIADVRHSNVTLLASDFILERRFENWSMAFAKVQQHFSKEFIESISLDSRLEKTTANKNALEILDRIVSDNQRTKFL